VSAGPAPDALDAARRHLRFGWVCVALFATLGVVLETLHGFKVGWYLDVANETRRMLLTLAHAHGVLIGLVNVVFGLTLRAGVRGVHRVASPALLAANVLLPGGFGLGGLVIYGGDPGLGVLLVPLGAACLLLGLWAVAWTLRP
jgi:hypothetical protein